MAAATPATHLSSGSATEVIRQDPVRRRRKRYKSADEHHPGGSVSRYVANDVPNPQMLRPARASELPHVARHLDGRVVGGRRSHVGRGPELGGGDGDWEKVRRKGTWGISKRR